LGTPLAMGPLRGRRWGDDGPAVIVLHGGPAAAGSARDLANGLVGYRAYEPWQRGAIDGPVTVARHVADLHVLIEDVGEPHAIVGHSWGAMLALAYAAAHPQPATPLVLVGCGTFDLESRAVYKQHLADRTPPELREHLDALAARLGSDPAAAMEYVRLAEPLDHVDPLPGEPDPDAPGFDAAAHGQTWDDMLRLQGEGAYPAAFKAILSPVLLVQGDFDPHPGTMIRDGLQAQMPQLEYVELAQCGHEPWRERHAREAFFETILGWLAAQPHRDR